jgi:signal transduction histidine kinase
VEYVVVPHWRDRAGRADDRRRLPAPGSRAHLAHDPAVPRTARRAHQNRGRAEQLLSQVVDEGRATVKGLRAEPSSQDLATALHQAARQQRNHQAIDFRVIVEGTPRPLQGRISDDIRHIAREAVVNAFQHSQARLIEVELAYSVSHFRCAVRDDGRGIDVGVLQRGRDDHWGLTGMRERAERVGAELRLRSSATAGTEIELLLDNQLAFGDAASFFRRWRPKRFTRRTSAKN